MTTASAMIPTARREYVSALFIAINIERHSRGDETARAGHLPSSEGTCPNEVKNAERMSTLRADRYYTGVMVQRAFVYC